jgi:hypothetical protein
VPGLTPATGAALQFGAVAGPSARFNLVSNITSGTLYYSFALKVTSLGALSTAGGPLAAFNNSRGTQSGTPFVLGTRILTRAAAAGRFNLGLAKNSTTPSDWVWATNSFNLNQTIFLVGSYTFNSNTSTDDISLLWINPASLDFGSNLAPAPALAATNGPDITSNQLASFVFLQSGLNNVGQPGATTADELRIGPSWASVTPSGIVPPSLKVARAAKTIVLSWPLTAPDYILESSAALGSNVAWTAASLPVSILGDHFTATNSSATGAKFYRLRK